MRPFRNPLLELARTTTRPNVRGHGDYIMVVRYMAEPLDVQEDA